MRRAADTACSSRLSLFVVIAAIDTEQPSALHAQPWFGGALAAGGAALRGIYPSFAGERERRFAEVENFLRGRALHEGAFRLAVGEFQIFQRNAERLAALPLIKRERLLAAQTED